MADNSFQNFKGEFKVTERCLTMRQLSSVLKQQQVKEMFGSGTACMICPIGNIVYQGENLHIPRQDNPSLKLTSRLTEVLTDIQYGRTPSDWTFMVC